MNLKDDHNKCKIKHNKPQECALYLAALVDYSLDKAICTCGPPQFPFKSCSLLVVTREMHLEMHTQNLCPLQLSIHPKCHKM